MRLASLAVLGTLVLTACGDVAGRPDPAGAGRSSSSSSGAEVVGVGMVLDDGDGPRLCVGAITASIPPQCDGRPLVGWDWDAVEHGEDLGVRTTTADVAVVGTWDGERLTVTRPPTDAGDRPRSDPFAGPVVERGTPCPEPAGGWVAPDPARATDDTRDDVATLADERGWELWLDQSRNPAAVDPSGEPGRANDPLLMVVNVRVGGGPERLAAVERELRATYGGAICVSEAVRDLADLRRIQAALVARDDIGWVEVGAGDGHVDLRVVHDDGTLQAELDRRHGVGVVRVASVLLPYAG